MTKVITSPTKEAYRVDALDARILALFADEPRIGVLEASRRLGVARGTVQARLDRLESTGVVRGWGPDVDAAALGYPVTAFLTLEIRQLSGHDPMAASLAAMSRPLLPAAPSSSTSLVTWPSLTNPTPDVVMAHLSCDWTGHRYDVNRGSGAKADAAGSAR